jgi:predicted outer membrane protein
MIRKAPMLRRIPRLLRISLIAAVLLAVSASVYQTWIAGNAGLGTTQTPYGPLSQGDVDLLNKVRQANLWEGPTSQQAQEMATSPQVRDVASKLAAEHAELDVETRRVADQLGVKLVSQPSTLQQGWMNQINAQTGANYDRTFVMLVRGAHGIVLPVINDVRVSTRNDLIRQFAETADSFVTRHCNYLESTGLVDYTALPTTQSSLWNVLTSGQGVQGLILPLLIFVAVMIGMVAMLYTLRKKKAESSKKSERVTVTKSRTPAARSAVSATSSSIPALNPVAALPVAGIADSGSQRVDTGARVPVGAFAGEAPGNATSSIPSPRGGEPSVQWTMGGPGYRDTGPQPTIVDAGYAPISDSGAYRINSSPDMTGPLGPPLRDDGYPAQYPAGYPAPPMDPGYREGPGSGHYYPPDPGQYRTVSATGGRRPGDSGSHRINDTGPRHSVRR